MLEKLANIAHSRWYWLAMLLTGLAFEAVALYYQYVRELPPCVLCIQVRLWIAVLILLALAVLLLHRFRPVLIAGHALTVVIAAGLLERSYQLLGTERGFIIGACGFDLGLPFGLAPDKWFPRLFEVQTTCGYTPELLFGVTMADFLIVASTGFVLLSLLMTALTLRGRAARSE